MGTLRVLFLAALGLALSSGQAAAASAGDLVITEMLIASGTGDAREWIEVWNPTAAAVDVTGCLFSDDTGSTTLGALVVQSQEYAILSKTSTCVVYDELGVCLRSADLTYSGVTLNNGTDSATLTCDGTIIDSVAYDWGDLSDDCLAPGSGHCTANLRAEAQDAVSNDVWPDSWCVPPEDQVTYDANGEVVLATPGGVGVCPESGPVCGPGDLIFTEFMVDPPTSSREWFEMKVVTGSGCDLQGCEIWEGTWETPAGDDDDSVPPGDDDDSAVPGDDDDSAAAGDDDDSAAPGDDDDSAARGEEEGDWRIHTIDAVGDSLFLEAGSYPLFSKTHDRVVGEEGAVDAIFADYVYSSISLQNSDPAWVRLVCEGVEIDIAPYDKAAFEDGCPDGGCSNNLRAEAEDDLLNDELSNWCLPPLEPDYLSSDGFPFIGTPGQPGACLERDWPTAGEVLISEIMVQAIDTPEWFELVSQSERDVDLGGCEMRRVRLDEPGGTEDPSTLQSHQLGSLGEPPELAAGSVVVFSKSDCLDGTEPSDTGACLWRESVQYTYGTLSFTNGEAERVSLFCPVVGSGEMVLVDAVEYDAVRTGNRSGHSVEFDVSLANAGSLNDDPYGWCDASFFDCIPELVTVDGECNYGTPGTAGPCTVGLVTIPDSGPGCVCDSVSGPTRNNRGGVGLLFLGLVFGALRRRVR